MRIVQTVFGAFHHFDLARELEAAGHLECVFSTWPRARLGREGLQRGHLQTFPWIHTPEYMLRRWHMLPAWLEDELGYANAVLFDEYTLRRVPACDALIALSGSSLKTGKLVQDRGGIFLCDRGSSHHRFQEQIIAEEYRQWGLIPPHSDPRDLAREEAIYHQADGIVVPSQSAARSFAVMGVDPAKVKVIPYGVRLENFSPASHPPDDCFEVLYVGVLEMRKGLPYLLQAFSQLKVPRKRLRIVGGMARGMAPFLQRFPMQDVEILGSVAQARLPAIMSSSHVMVLPSIEEGLALVQGQALACGCPVIGTTNTGADDLFTDGVEGFIVPIRDSAAIAARMQCLAEDPALQQRMRAAGIERVKSFGGWSTYGMVWQEHLKQLTGATEAIPQLR